MIFFKPNHQRKNTPTLVDQSVQAIEQAIHKRVLRPGMSLPSIREFAHNHGISTYTVAAAYDQLVARGLIQSQPGVGYRVVRPKLAKDTSVPKWVMPRIGSAWLLTDVFADYSISIKAGSGWLPSEWYNESGIMLAMRQISRTQANQISPYGHPLGYYPLREHITQRLLEHGVETSTDQILLTHGATQALDIVVRTILRPGDHVAVESPCYANLLQILSLSQITVHAVPRTHNGICEKTLEQLAKKHPIRAMFVTTVLQNPTGASFSMEGAFRLLLLADRHDFLVIEDDVSRDLLPEPAPMLAALGGQNRVIQISGFSKSLMPSIRVGYLSGARALVEQCTHTKMSLGLTSSELMERTAYQVLCNGRHNTYMRNIRDRLNKSHDMVSTLMHKQEFTIWTEPGAGLFLWAKPPFPISNKSLKEIVARALKAGIWLAPGSYFDPNGHKQDWFRFNVAYSENQQLWDFFQDERNRTLDD